MPNSEKRALTLSVSLVGAVAIALGGILFDLYPQSPHLYAPVFGVSVVSVGWLWILEHPHSGPTRRAIRDAAQRDLRGEELGELTYFRYRDAATPTLYSSKLIAWLEDRYACEALRLPYGSEYLSPVSIVWQASDLNTDPDSILGTLDMTPPMPHVSAAHLDPAMYAEAREFIKGKYESGKIQREGCDYRMTRITLSDDAVTIDGAFGLYYDNILTQYALEWELKKALFSCSETTIDQRLGGLSERGSLPLREAIEGAGNPMYVGSGRCAAITVSTLPIFKRPTQEGYWTVIRRRSLDVGVSPGMLHVVPAGMFEADNTSDRWSIERNVWRELLEELYDEEEQQGGTGAENRDDIEQKNPVPLLNAMRDDGRAQLVVTGIVCDLLNLRPEICTVLFIDDPEFARARGMKLNWEYDPEPRSGVFALPWTRIDDVIATNFPTMVPSGAACLLLGRQWASRAHRI